MRLSLVLTLLLAASVAGGQISVARMEQVSLFGHSYVRLTAWARSNQFALTTTAHREILLSNRFHSVKFEIDSRRAEIDGIEVWLAAAVAYRNGIVYISPTDLLTLVQPLLFPARNDPGKKIRHICLDPGHGGKDPGNLDGKQMEKKYTLLLAREVGALLKGYGLKVSFTRSSDATIDVEKRPEIARKKGADLFISLHFNTVSATRSDVKGSEVYCMTPPGTSSTNARGEGANSGGFSGNRQNDKNILLAYQLQKSLVKGLKMNDRGVRRARFAMLRPATMPAALIEAGFMSNSEDARRIYDARERKKVAQAIADGILAYIKIVER